MMDKRKTVSGWWWLGAAVIAPLLAMGAYWAYAGLTHPVINDIVTDPDAPLAFQAMPQTVPYPGEVFAGQQRAAYPDVLPLQLGTPPRQAHALALELMRTRGWTVVSVSPSELRIEATEQSMLFRFTDEIVLQVTESATGARIDMRSRSRLGRSDLGVNAKRIRAFLAELQARAGQDPLTAR